MRWMFLWDGLLHTRSVSKTGGHVIRSWSLFCSLGEKGMERKSKGSIQPCKAKVPCGDMQEQMWKANRHDKNDRATPVLACVRLNGHFS